jgi:hypothetical protein
LRRHESQDIKYRELTIAESMSISLARP